MKGPGWSWEALEAILYAPSAAGAGGEKVETAAVSVGELEPPDSAPQVVLTAFRAPGKPVCELRLSAEDARNLGVSLLAAGTASGQPFSREDALQEIVQSLRVGQQARYGSPGETAEPEGG